MSERENEGTRQAAKGCCSTEEQKVCCEPSAKAGCCGGDDPEQCGC